MPGRDNDDLPLDTSLRADPVRHDPVRHDPVRHYPARRDERFPIDPDLSPDDPGEPAIGHLAGPGINRARDLRVLAAIAIGGFAGTLARYGVGLAWTSSSGHFPWAIFTINASGSFLLGLILTILLEKVRPDRYVRPLLCVGVLGSWTTMSSLAVGSDLLVRAHEPGTAVIYVVLTVLVGLSLTWSGIHAARFVKAWRPS
jgi:fluoride exporter